MRVPIRKPGKYTHSKPDPRITGNKLEELKSKLHKLKAYDQPRAIKEVERLVHDGDFSENAGYQMAKGQLRGINQRILDLEDQINHAYVIVPSNDSNYVQLGNTVTLEIDDKKTTYLILGSVETDPANGIISDQSPIGSKLVGKKIGDKITLAIDGKESECRVVNIV